VRYFWASVLVRMAARSRVTAIVLFIRQNWRGEGVVGLRDREIGLPDAENSRGGGGLYELFVVDSITSEDGTVFSCGMHNLGLRDTIVSGEDFQDAADLIKIFGYYQLIDKPVIKENQTFQIDTESPIFRITTELHPPYGEDGPFYNPYGVWRLTRAFA
jgi:hypothetical protein